MSNDFTVSVFTGLKINGEIKKDTKVVFVADFFAEDLLGGAELTTEAILKKSTVKYQKLHCKKLSPEIIQENKDKYWVFGNFAMVSPLCISYLIDNNIKYSIIEFDFKYCVFRSVYKHFLETGKPCDCMNQEHGKTIEKFYKKADRIFWMSEKQKELFLRDVPSLNDSEKHIVQSSTFLDETLEKLKVLRETHKNSDEKEKQIWFVQNSNSWVKDSQNTVNWCRSQNMNVKLVGNMPYDQFLTELAKSYGLVFRPSGEDTAPRIVIEAKLLGLELKLNNNVLHKDEEWFKGSIEDCEEFLKGRAGSFWKELEKVI